MPPWRSLPKRFQVRITEAMSLGGLQNIYCAGFSPWTDLAVLDPNERLEALVGGVEVGRRMLVMVHADDDAEEEGDGGHSGYVGRRATPKKSDAASNGAK